MLGSFFENFSDVYCKVEVAVDTKKHVKPIEVKPIPKVSADKKEVSGIFTADKFLTMTKYSFYESGRNWVKVLLDMKDIKKHSEDKI